MLDDDEFSYETLNNSPLTWIEMIWLGGMSLGLLGVVVGGILMWWFS